MNKLIAVLVLPLMLCAAAQGTNGPIITPSKGSSGISGVTAGNGLTGGGTTGTVTLSVDPTSAVTFSSETVTGQMNVGGEMWIAKGQSGNSILRTLDNTYFILWSGGSQAMEFFVNNANPMILSNNDVVYPASTQLQFLSGGFGNPADLGMYRSSAGVLEIDNGSIGQLRDLSARTVNAGSLVVTGGSAPPDSQALCLSGGALGHCTSVVGAGGGCTCSVP